MKHEGKIKFSLIASIGISILAVSSAAVSTFAWFSANANVNVEAATSDPVSITVSAPDPIQAALTLTFYEYNGNETIGHSSALSSLAWTDNWSTTTSASNISGMYPGMRKSFCLKVHCETAIPNLTITLSSFTDNKATENKTRYKLTNATTDPVAANELKLSGAMKMYGVVQTSSTYSEPTGNGAGKTLVAGTTSWTNANTAANDIYIFYTFLFEDIDQNHFYEYEKLAANSYARIYTNTSGNTDVRDRYFLQADAGNMSCYEGMSLKINTFALSVS